MSKKAGKLLALTAVIGAAAGAVYYYKNLEKKMSDSCSFDDLDDFEDEEINDDLDAYLKQEAENAEKSDREYVPLQFSKETMDEARKTIRKAAEGLEEVVLDAVTKLRSNAQSTPAAAEPVSNILKPDDDTSIEEFKFDDLEACEDDFEDIEGEIADSTLPKD